MRIRLGDLRRLIREALVDGEDLAASVSEYNADGTVRKAVVYDAGRLLSFDVGDAGVDWDGVLKGVGVGFIQLVRAEEMGYGPCRGGWMVQYSFGPRRGDLIYSLGFGLASPDPVIADRKVVSRKAQGRWKKMVGSHSGEPLDNIRAHGNDEILFPHPNHTEDPEDDCECYEDEEKDFLNYARYGKSEDVATLRRLSKRHDEVAEAMKVVDERMGWKKGFVGEIENYLLQRFSEESELY